MLLSSSNRKNKPFPLQLYVSVVVCLRCLFHHILSRIAYTFREKRDFVIIIIMQFMMSANSQMRLQIMFVCMYITPSHYHHCANLSEDIELIKCLSHIFFECVRISIFSQLSIMRYMVLYLFNLPIPLVMIEKIYIFCLIIIIKSEALTFIHCLGLRHETMAFTVYSLIAILIRQENFKN